MTDNKETPRGQKVTQTEMLKQIWDEVRYVRKRLDDHVDPNDEEIALIKKDIGSLRTDLAGQRVKIGLMFSGIGIAITAMGGWLAKHITNLSA